MRGGVFLLSGSVFDGGCCAEVLRGEVCLVVYGTVAFLGSWAGFWDVRVASVISRWYCQRLT